ncbi:Protein of unknown function [Thalassobacillus cyri]|uniref:DUF4064 domain-containing protein n=1 Tax=Thalassobacillus cyri TaxID=571932 RepID=A0A1H3YYA5_9BACI|nr:DUF4064 domain-containing protein [Thalassobacillus cyri]SEA16052.1 Protein of unknown function [Thalassobacillus cyri]
MKRTAEIVLTGIGVVLYGLIAGMLSIVVNVKDNPEFRESLEGTIQQDPEANLEEINVDQMIEGIADGAMIIIITGIIALLIGVVAIYFIKGNKKPKLAGILLIVTAVIATVITVGVGVVAGLFYIVAGIIGIVRKPKPL